MHVIRLLLPALALAAACRTAPAAAPSAVPEPALDAAGTVIPRFTRSPGGHAEGMRYAPMDMPLAWTRNGDLLVLHVEHYQSYDVVAQTCGGTGIYLVPQAGGPSRPVATGQPLCDARDLEITVSPDGAWAVFAEWFRPNNARLLRLDVATGRVDTLPTGCTIALGNPLFSPDGSRIAAIGACRDRQEDYGVWLMNADGSGIRRAGAAPPNAYAMAWSPDGRSLATVAREEQIFIAEADGARRRVLTRGREPAWSPDGAWIAFLDQLPAERRATGLYVVRADGSGRRLLYRNRLQTTYASGFGDRLEGEPRGPLLWSPDGRSILFTRKYGRGMPIWRIEVETGLVQPVTAPAR
jgi:Tol biopolymer transport system component